MKSLSLLQKVLEYMFSMVLLSKEARAYSDFYPDPATVDILAADVYRQDYCQSHHDELISLGMNKPIALGEIGEVPTDSILNAQPNWTWFMIWGYFANVYNEPEKVKAL